MKRFAITLLAVALASLASAGEITSTKEVVVPPPAPGFFKDFEFQADVFGTLHLDRSRSDSQPVYHSASGGGGFGVNYFFYRYFGVGTEADFASTYEDVVTSLHGNVILRYPMEFQKFGLAPYIFGGGGGIWLSAETEDRPRDSTGALITHHGRYGHHNKIANGDIGLGLEFRFTPHIGVFAEGQYDFLDQHIDDTIEVRSGVRVAF